MKMALPCVAFVALSSIAAADPFGKLVNYDRNAFGGWADIDVDCQNTRHELLISRSLWPAKLRPDGCLVLRGSWIDPYSAEVHHKASEVDIDHLVPLKFAWNHGAWGWEPNKMEQFANDPENLVITKKSLNRSKGSDGPLQWLPPNDAFVCAYIDRFLVIMDRYSLKTLEDEAQAFGDLKTTICLDE